MTQSLFGRMLDVLCVILLFCDSHFGDRQGARNLLTHIHSLIVNPLHIQNTRLYSAHRHSGNQPNRALLYSLNPNFYMITILVIICLFTPVLNGKVSPGPNMKTHILILLDESGSMESQKSDVIGGFNTFINDQKEVKEDEANVTFIKFNTRVTKVVENVPVANVPTLDFVPGGGTSLYDAIWEGVQLVEKTEGNFDRFICVIMTDGEDNSSRMITKEGIGHLIKKKEGEGIWTFLYIGENPEQWAKQTGQSVRNVSGYNHAEQGTNFSEAHRAVRNVRVQQERRMENAFDNVD